MILNLSLLISWENQVKLRGKVCVCACVRVCVRVCVCVSVKGESHADTEACAGVSSISHPRTHASHARTHTHTRARAHTHTHTHTQSFSALPAARWWSGLWKSTTSETRHTAIRQTLTSNCHTARILESAAYSASVEESY